MATSRDPLGKRALFWAPGERVDPKPLDDVVPACVRHGLGVLPYFPLASGLLTG